MDRQIKLEVDAARSRFKMNEAAFRGLIGAHGPVARTLVRRALAVHKLAVHNASEPPRGGVPNAGSEPGKGPAVRTGRLRASITWRLGEDAIGLYADIGSAVLYAPYVELGTSRMEARPYLRPALEAARIP